MQIIKRIIFSKLLLVVVILGLVLTGLWFLSRPVSPDYYPARQVSLACMTFNFYIRDVSGYDKGQIEELREGFRETFYDLFQDQLSRKQVYCLLRLCALRDQKTASLVKERIFDRPEDIYNSRVFLWALLHIQEERAAPTFVRYIQEEGKEVSFAVSCLERIAFKKTEANLSNRKAVVEEWSQWVQVHQKTDWDELLASHLRKRGLLDKDEVLEEKTLKRLVEHFPMKGKRTYWMKERPEVETCVAMRISELLCEKTGELDISPGGFPTGFPDKSWASWKTALRNKYGREGLRSWKEHKEKDKNHSSE